MAKANNGIHIQVEVNKRSIGDKVWNTNVWNVGLNYDIGRKFAKIVDPWVPYDTGKLSKDITIGTSAISGGIDVVYTADYASKQYYGDEFHHKTEVHPLASAHWADVAMQTEREHFVKEVEDLIRERYRHGQE